MQVWKEPKIMFLFERRAHDGLSMTARQQILLEHAVNQVFSWGKSCAIKDM